MQHVGHVASVSTCFKSFFIFRLRKLSIDAITYTATDIYLHILTLCSVDIWEINLNMLVDIYIEKETTSSISSHSEDAFAFMWIISSVSLIPFLSC